MRRRPPIETGSEQRYWRRKGNLRVRKARLTRHALRLLFPVLAGITLGGVIVGSTLRAVDEARRSDEFVLARIEIAGARHCPANEIERLVAPHLGDNLLDLDLELVRVEVHDNRWVRGASVRRVLPETLRVTVFERQPAAFAVIGGVAHLIDDTGYVIGPAGEGLTGDLPVLTGLDRLPQEELTDGLRQGVTVLARLRDAVPHFAAGISEMDLSQADRLVVRTLAPGPRLLLDREQAERNVDLYLELSGQMEARVGSMDYVDLRWRGRIAAMPALRSAGTEGG